MLPRHHDGHFADTFDVDVVAVMMKFGVDISAARPKMAMPESPLAPLVVSRSATTSRPPRASAPIGLADPNGQSPERIWIRD